MNAKSIFASKTLWTNLVLLVGAVGAYFQGQSDLNTMLAIVAPAILNFALRLVTKQPIG